ncbi:ATP-binding protein [Streptomyces ziwulingensis]|uniref:ATP-binding protein n=1 Tax=Streptomyces ziwulingensis TaxID=1045501 RepID=UPI003CD0BC22
MFHQRLSATRRGARLARRFTTRQLHTWGIPYGSDLSETVTLVVAELAANAVLHGRVPGRDIALRLRVDAEVVRVEILDARGECLPLLPGAVPDAEADTGRGLLLVDALTTRWGVDTEPGPGKSVWAEIEY